MSHPANRCNFRSLPATSPQGTLPGPELPTPVQIERLLPLLHGYDVELVHALHNGFKFGFPIHFQGPRVSLYEKI